MALSMNASVALAARQLAAPRRSAGPAAGRGSLTVVAAHHAVVVLTGSAGVAGTVTFTQEATGARSPSLGRLALSLVSFASLSLSFSSAHTPRPAALLVEAVSQHT